MTIASQDADRFLVVPHQGAHQSPAIVSIKRDAVADRELQHRGVCPHLLKKIQALDDSAVEVDQFGFSQVINSDGHGRSSATSKEALH